jgi:hypothetical protein
MPFAGIFFSVSISRMVLLSLWFGRVWMCSKVFSFFLFFLPVDLWMDRRDWRDQEKKKKRLFFACECEREGGMNRSECKSAVSVPLYRYFSLSTAELWVVFSLDLLVFSPSLFFWMVPILWNSFI